MKLHLSTRRPAVTVFPIVLFWPHRLVPFANAGSHPVCHSHAKSRWDLFVYGQQDGAFHLQEQLGSYHCQEETTPSTHDHVLPFLHTCAILPSHQTLNISQRWGKLHPEQNWITKRKEYWKTAAAAWKKQQQQQKNAFPQRRFSVHKMQWGSYRRQCAVVVLHLHQQPVPCIAAVQPALPLRFSLVPKGSWLRAEVWRC